MSAPSGAANKAAEEEGELPELPIGRAHLKGLLYTALDMLEYARQSIAADRASRQVANKAEVEPIGYVNGDELDNMLDDRTATIQSARSGWRATPLYATPPATTGASTVLTDERIDEIARPWVGMGGVENQYAFARAIEREVAAQAGQVAPADQNLTEDQKWLLESAEMVRNGGYSDLASKIRAACKATVFAGQVAVPEMTDEQIVAVWQAMPGGPDGWLKQFGYLQFARALLAAAPSAPPVAQQAPAATIDTREFRELLAKAMDAAELATRTGDPHRDYKPARDALVAHIDARLGAPVTPEAPIDAGIPASVNTAAARDVLAERQRQVQVEGWTPAHDDQYRNGIFPLAASCYALAGEVPLRTPPREWPWPDQWWKPSNHRRNLVKASTLLLAEIERLDRAAAPKGGV